ncbi:MAG: hypothetical protein GY832_13355 [Chloroflexi bacterium]|nr:hypothetical protein [Chloroflexota bacterium]
MSGTSVMELLVIVVIVALVFVLGRWLSRRSKGEPVITVTSTREPSTTRPAARDRLSQPFADVERQVEALRRQVRDRLLTEEECKVRMRKLMVEDADGNWWMVGYETGEWHCHDGTDWVRADPPSGP